MPKEKDYEKDNSFFKRRAGPDFDLRDAEQLWDFWQTAEQEQGKGNGYDAANDEYVDMVNKGIIDPTKVSRSALQNAASIAATLLTTESIVTDIPTPPSPVAPGGGDMGGMY